MAMRILHTSDWHLGRSLHEYSLLKEQRAFLDWLGDFLEASPFDVLVIAGDLYDRSVPPPEAVTLFSEFLIRTRKACPNLHVCAIAGNHDGAERLSFAAGILDQSGIHLRTTARDGLSPVLISAGGVTAQFHLQPFLYPGSVRHETQAPGDTSLTTCVTGLPASSGTTPQSGSKDETESSDPDLSAALDAIRQTPLSPGAVRVLVSHCFTQGGRVSDSERAFVGTAGRIAAGAFHDFPLALLGHLHGRQAPAANVLYSGSPLPYSFSESGNENALNSISLSEDGSFTCAPVPVPLSRRMVRLSGTLKELLDEARALPNRENFIEATLTDGEPIPGVAELLRARYPQLLSLRQSMPGQARLAPGEAPAPLPSRATSPIEEYADFLQALALPAADISERRARVEQELPTALAGGHDLVGAAPPERTDPSLGAAPERTDPSLGAAPERTGPSLGAVRESADLSIGAARESTLPSFGARPNGNNPTPPKPRRPRTSRTGDNGETP